MLCVSSDQHDQAGHDERAIADALDLRDARADRGAEHDEIQRGRRAPARRCSASSVRKVRAISNL